MRQNHISLAAERQSNYLPSISSAELGISKRDMQGTNQAGDELRSVPPAGPMAAQSLLDGIMGSWKAQAVRVVAELRVPDLLAGGPMSAGDLAELTGSDGRGSRTARWPFRKHRDGRVAEVGRSPFAAVLGDLVGDEPLGGLGKPGILRSDGSERTDVGDGQGRVRASRGGPRERGDLQPGHGRIDPARRGQRGAGV